MGICVHILKVLGFCCIVNIGQKIGTCINASAFFSGQTTYMYDLKMYDVILSKKSFAVEIVLDN